MTTKQRAYLKGLAMTMDPIFQIGKASMNPGLPQSVSCTPGKRILERPTETDSHQ